MICSRRLLRRERRFSANKEQSVRQARSLATIYIFARVRITGALVPFYVIGNSSEFPITYKRTADNQQSEELCDGLVYNVWLNNLENFIHFIALMDCEFDWFGKVKAEDTHN